MVTFPSPEGRGPQGLPVAQPLRGQAGRGADHRGQLSPVVRLGSRTLTPRDMRKGPEARKGRPIAEGGHSAAGAAHAGHPGLQGPCSARVPPAREKKAPMHIVTDPCVCIKTASLLPVPLPNPSSKVSPEWL